MLDLAAQQVGYGLEPTMRVRREAEMVAGSEVDRPHLVQQQKRVESVEGGTGKSAPQFYAIAIARPWRSKHPGCTTIGGSGSHTRLHNLAQAMSRFAASSEAATNGDPPRT